MSQIEFQYNGISTIIQCIDDQAIYEICNKFISKSNLNEDNLHYVYNGKGFKQFDKKLTFNQMANSFDKERKKMNILVISNENNTNNTNNNNNGLIRSKNIICPKCGEDIKIKKIENYKIYLFECKNNHKRFNIPLNEFDKTQMINIKNIKCNICKEMNKYNTYNNEFYKCFECNINICPLCKLKHNKEHNIINYDIIHYIYNKHEGEKFVNYCDKCKINVCSLCDKEHLNHKKFSIINIILDKEELLIKLDELKKSINIFNENINKIIEILNNVKNNMDNYYKLEEYIINSYNKKERNYEILYNIDKIINYNNTIINDINQINNEYNIQNKFNYINNIYNKINNNEIQLTIKIGKDDINKKIYFLDNTDGNIPVRLEVNEESEYGLKEIREKHNHDFLKELNELNTELYINNKKYKYEKYVIPEKEGKYHILLKFNILMTDCSFMFYGCKNITNIDLSLFNTQNVTNMIGMFNGCCNLTNVDLSSFNTQNVTNMASMFNGCDNLINIDITTFNTQNVTNMVGMFTGCYKLTNIDLSSFNTQNVTNMASMFNRCSSLINIDLSTFDIKKVINFSLMFNRCNKLKEMKINKNLYEKNSEQLNEKEVEIKFFD